MLYAHPVGVRVVWGSKMEAAFDQQSITALMVGASAKLDVLWQIFILLHFGVFTLLLIHQAVLNRWGQLAAALGYGFVMTINFLALTGTYRVLDALHQQFRNDFGGAVEKFVPALRDTFLNADLSGRPSLLFLSHGIAGLIVVIAIVRSGLLVTSVGRT